MGTVCRKKVSSARYWSPLITIKTGTRRVGCVSLMTNRHRPDRPQYNPQTGRELIVPTSFSPELTGECLRILEAIYRPGYQHTKADVLCLELVPDDEKQASLFRRVDPAREKKSAR